MSAARAARGPRPGRPFPIWAWLLAIGVAAGVRLWNALTDPLMWGYDAWGHVAYVLFLDLYRAVPWADQGWSYYQPPLHYALGWVLAQFGSGEVLMRGLPMLAGAASLGTAGLAAKLARLADPERPGLALLAFCAVAFLPVQIYMSGMPGNEMTVGFLNAAALAAFIHNERREHPGLGRDALTGALLGLAALAKHNGFLSVAAVAGTLLLRVALSPARGRELRRVALRGAVLVVAILAIAGQHYLRNLAAYGNPIPTNRDYPLVSDIERDQPPGSRRWSDYLSLPPRLITDPNPLAPHMLHSVWGSLYMNAWAETHRESDRGRALEAERVKRPSTSLMGILGIAPTAVALAGAVLAARDVRRGRRRALYVPLLVLSGIMLVAFAVFVWRVPIWAAVKASYCLSLSLPYGVFTARGVEALLSRSARWQRVVPLAALVAAAAGAAVVGTSGVVVPRRRDAPAAGAVHYYFGEYSRARRVYAPYLAETAYKPPWLENLAAVELAEGHPDRARRLYARAVELADRSGRSDPRRAAHLAVAASLEGDLEAARALLDPILAAEALAEPMANRGAIRAAQGDLAGAEVDLRAALELEPALVPAWRNLAFVLEREGRRAEAERARARAGRQACLPPRRYPYGVGTGEILEWGVGRRPLLLLDDAGLRPALPDFYRQMCEDDADSAASTRG